MYLTKHFKIRIARKNTENMEKHGKTMKNTEIHEQAFPFKIRKFGYPWGGLSRSRHRHRHRLRPNPPGLRPPSPPPPPAERSASAHHHHQALRPGAVLVCTFVPLLVSSPWGCPMPTPGGTTPFLHRGGHWTRRGGAYLGLT